MTSNYDDELHIYLEDFECGEYYALYDTFAVGNWASGYALTIGGYDPSSSAGDSFYQTGKQFSTSDHDADDVGWNCAQAHRGGWWYAGCTATNLNGVYFTNPITAQPEGIFWNAAKGLTYSMKKSIMKLRRKVQECVMVSYPTSCN